MYTIKQVSELLGMNPNAIRFYEEKGLISPERGENNYREYIVEHISQLEMIVLYRKMGFSVDAIGSIMNSKSNGELLSQFVSQYEILNHHIHTMTAVRETLGSCVELLLNGGGLADGVVSRMGETARTIAKSNQWEDRWDFDDWASQYDVDIRKAASGLDFYGNYDEVMKKTAAQIVGGRVVEIGVGTGNLAQTVLGCGIKPCNYIGIDQSVNMLRQTAAKCLGIALRIGTFLQLPLPERICDTVVSSYAFHHCNSGEKPLALGEMRRVLGEHGRIVITDLMFADTKAREVYEKKASPNELRDLKDEYFACVDELERSLEDLGFRCCHEQVDGLIWIVTAEK